MHPCDAAVQSRGHVNGICPKRSRQVDFFDFELVSIFFALWDAFLSSTCRSESNDSKLKLFSFLRSPFYEYGRACCWAVLEHLKPKGPKGREARKIVFGQGPIFALLNLAYTEWQDTNGTEPVLCGTAALIDTVSGPAQGRTEFNHLLSRCLAGLQQRSKLGVLPPLLPIPTWQLEKMFTFWGQLKVGLYGSTPFEGLNLQSLDMMGLGLGLKNTVPSCVPQLRCKLLNRSAEPLDSYGATPKACSDRNGATAIRSAVADVP